MINKFLKIFSFFSDLNRLKLYSLLLLYPDGLFVCEICKILNLPYYSVSRKLKELELIELVYSIRKGKFILYLPNNSTDELLVKLNFLVLEISKKSNFFNLDKINEILNKRNEINCFCSNIKRNKKSKSNKRLKIIKKQKAKNKKISK